MAVLKILGLFLLIGHFENLVLCQTLENYYSDDFEESSEETTFPISADKELTHVRTKNLSGNVRLTTLQVLTTNAPLDELNNRNEEERIPEPRPSNENKQSEVQTIPENHSQVVLLSELGTKAPTDGPDSYALMDAFNGTSGTLPDQAATEKLITVTPLNFNPIQEESTTPVAIVYAEKRTESSLAEDDVQKLGANSTQSADSENSIEQGTRTDVVFIEGTSMTTDKGEEASLFSNGPSTRSATSDKTLSPDTTEMEISSTFQQSMTDYIHPSQRVNSLVDDAFTTAVNTESSMSTQGVTEDNSVTPKVTGLNSIVQTTLNLDQSVENVEDLSTFIHVDEELLRTLSHKEDKVTGSDGSIEDVSSIMKDLEDKYRPTSTKEEYFNSRHLIKEDTLTSPVDVEDVPNEPILTTELEAFDQYTRTEKSQSSGASTSTNDYNKLIEGVTTNKVSDFLNLDYNNEVTTGSWGTTLREEEEDKENETDAYESIGVTTPRLLDSTSGPTMEDIFKAHINESGHIRQMLKEAITKEFQKVQQVTRDAKSNLTKFYQDMYDANQSSSEAIARGVYAQLDNLERLCQLLVKIDNDRSTKESTKKYFRLSRENGTYSLQDVIQSGAIAKANASSTSWQSLLDDDVDQIRSVWKQVLTNVDQVLQENEKNIDDEDLDEEDYDQAPDKSVREFLEMDIQEKIKESTGTNRTKYNTSEIAAAIRSENMKMEARKFEADRIEPMQSSEENATFWKGIATNVPQLLKDDQKSTDADDLDEDEDYEEGGRFADERKGLLKREESTTHVQVFEPVMTTEESTENKLEAVTNHVLQNFDTTTIEKKEVATTGSAFGDLTELETEFEATRTPSSEDTVTGNTLDNFDAAMTEKSQLNDEITTTFIDLNKLVAMKNEENGFDTREVEITIELSTMSQLGEVEDSSTFLETNNTVTTINPKIDEENFTSAHQDFEESNRLATTAGATETISTVAASEEHFTISAQITTEESTTMVTDVKDNVFDTIVTKDLAQTSTRYKEAFTDRSFEKNEEPSASTSGDNLTESRLYQNNDFITLTVTSRPEFTTTGMKTFENILTSTEESGDIETITKNISVLTRTEVARRTTTGFPASTTRKSSIFDIFDDYWKIQNVRAAVIRPYVQSLRGYGNTNRLKSSDRKVTKNEETEDDVGQKMKKSEAQDFDSTTINMSGEETKNDDQDPQLFVNLEGKYLHFSVQIVYNETRFFIPSDAVIEVQSPSTLNISWQSSTPDKNNSLELNLGHSVQLNIVKSAQIRVYKRALLPQLENKLDVDAKVITLDDGIRIYFSNIEVFKTDQGNRPAVRAEPLPSTPKQAEVLAAEIIGGFLGVFGIVGILVYYAVRFGAKVREFKPNVSESV